MLCYKLHEAETDTCSISYTRPFTQNPSILKFSGGVPLCHRVTGYRRCYIRKSWYLHLQRPSSPLTLATLPTNRVWRLTNLDPQQHGSDNPKSSSAQSDLQLTTFDCRTVTRIPRKPNVCVKTAQSEPSNLCFNTTLNGKDGTNF